jgi:hypothetical protein
LKDHRDIIDGLPACRTGFRYRNPLMARLASIPTRHQKAVNRWTFFAACGHRGVLTPSERTYRGEADTPTGHQQTGPEEFS